MTMTSNKVMGGAAIIGGVVLIWWGFKKVK